MENGTNKVTPTNYLTRLAHLATLPASLQHRSPTMKRICQVLARNPHGARALTRREVMTQACSPEAMVGSGGCYWRRMHTGVSKDACGRKYHDEARYSVIINGLVRVAGKRGRQNTYELTPAGELFARS